MAIIKVESLKLHKDDDTFQVSEECKALNSIGLIYDLQLTISADSSKKEANGIVAEMKTGSLFLTGGSYTVIQKNLIIAIHNEKHFPLPPDWEEEELRHGFKMNVNPLMKVQ